MHSILRYKEFIRFGIVGVLATTIHYSVYLVLNLIIVSWLAYSIGYGISFLCNFYLSSVFTINKERNRFRDKSWNQLSAAYSPVITFP